MSESKPEAEVKITVRGDVGFFWRDDLESFSDLEIVAMMAANGITRLVPFTLETMDKYCLLIVDSVGGNFVGFPIKNLGGGNILFEAPGSENSPRIVSAADCMKITPAYPVKPREPVTVDRSTTMNIRNPENLQAVAESLRDARFW